MTGNVIKMENPSYAHPSQLSPQHMLAFSIGTYFQTFSHVELLLSVLATLIMKVDIRTVQFLWRDAGFRMKTEGVRRAAKEAFGEKDERYSRVHGVLNKIENLSHYRNALAHGTFMGTTDAAQILGRPGQSFNNMHANFQGIDAGKTVKELAKLQASIGEITSLVTSLSRPTKT